MKVLAITQARYGSTRFPAKILKEINNHSLLEIHLKRILQSRLISKVKVATTVEEGSIHIVEVASSLGIDSYRGSVDNVLERFYKTAETEQPDYVVRLTSDCPLIDPEIIDKVINECLKSDFDYLSNVLDPTYPDGMDVEVFKFAALKRAYDEATLKSDKEHVTPYIWRNSSFKGGNLFTSNNVYNENDLSDYRLTIDTVEDFDLIKILIEKLGYDKSFNDYITYINEHNEIRKINQIYSRNEGYDKSLLNDKN